MTPTDESLFRGAARAALATGVPVSIRYGADALADLQVVLDEGLPADRVVVGDLDRADAVAAGWPAAVAERGAYVAIDHVGLNDDDDFVRDAERAALVAELVAAGHADRVLLSGNAIGVAKGHPAYELPYAHVLTAFVPLLASHGVADEDIQRILVANPRDLLDGALSRRATERGRTCPASTPSWARSRPRSSASSPSTSTSATACPARSSTPSGGRRPEQRYEETVPKLRQFAEYSRAYGGPTFVDATGICNGRDVDYYKSLSAKTGVHIVAGHRLRRRRHRAALLRRGQRRLPHAAVRPRDHRRHRRHRRQGRDHQGRREPRRSG